MKPTVLFLALCAVLMAQDAPQPAPQQGGWRKFEDNPPASQAAPNRGPYQNGPYQQGPYQPGPYAAPPAAPAQIILPPGSFVTLRVNQPLSSDHSQQGDAFTATLTQPLVAQGFVVARRGETIGGRVVEAKKAGMVKGTSELKVELTDLTLADGTHVPLKSEFVQFSGGTSVGRDAAAIGTTTGLGAAIGAAAAGGFGAGMGAIAGAGASAIGVLVTRGHQTLILPEDTLTFKTTEAVTVDTTKAPLAFLPVHQQDYNPAPSLQRRPAYAAAPPPVYRPYPPYPYYYPYYGPYYGGGLVIVGGGHFHR